MLLAKLWQNCSMLIDFTILRPAELLALHIEHIDIFFKTSGFSKSSNFCFTESRVENNVGVLKNNAF